MSDIHVFIEHFQGKVADISYICLAQAKEIAGKSGSKVVAVLMGDNVEKLSKNLLADEILLVEQDTLKDLNYTAYVTALTQIIQEKKPSLVLLGDTSVGSDLAGGLSFRTGLPLVSFCTEILPGAGLTYVAQICSGKINVQGALPTDGVIVTMLPGKYKPENGQSATAPAVTKYPVSQLESGGIVMKEIILPSGDDLDISKEKILVAVGRGIENEDNVGLAQELADALGGVLCASRPVVDQGWIPTTRLVGKSGKTVKPKLYLALGISGAPEHVEAIGQSEMVIAVNTDPKAPIFDYARYGTTEDLMDVSEELIRSIEELKGG
jgi:electron transfer flavoprotein alpha subunit